MGGLLWKDWQVLQAHSIPGREERWLREIELRLGGLRVHRLWQEWGTEMTTALVVRHDGSEWIIWVHGWDLRYLVQGIVQGHRHFALHMVCMQDED